MIAVATTEHLIEINQRNGERNQGLTREGEQLLDPDGFHVVWQSFPHNDAEMRTVWLLKLRDNEYPQHGIVDMSFADYDELVKRSAKFTGLVRPTAEEITTAMNTTLPEIEQVTAWGCEECDSTLRVASIDSLYECPRCLLIYNRSDAGGTHKCPDCGGYGAKVGDHSCSYCGQGPVFEVTAWGVEGRSELFTDREAARKAAHGSI